MNGLSGPTRAIKTNAQNLLILMTITAIILLIFGFLLRFFELNQIHQSIGIYGLKVAEANGMNVNGISASWWNGYEILENGVQQDFGIAFGFGLGITLAIFPLAMMYRYAQRAIHRIEQIEKIIGEEEKHGH